MSAIRLYMAQIIYGKGILVTQQTRLSKRNFPICIIYVVVTKAKERNLCRLEAVEECSASQRYLL